MNGVMKLSPVEFAALFDGLDRTRVQTIQAIPPTTVAVQDSRVTDSLQENMRNLRQDADTFRPVKPPHRGAKRP
jgi:hypothetical protein